MIESMRKLLEDIWSRHYEGKVSYEVARTLTIAVYNLHDDLDFEDKRQDILLVHGNEIENFLDDFAAKDI